MLEAVPLRLALSEGDKVASLEAARLAELHRQGEQRARVAVQRRVERSWGGSPKACRVFTGTAASVRA